MTKTRPQHIPLYQFPIIDDSIHIGKLPLTQLVRRVGKTPFYAYDRQKITEKITLLRQHLPAEVHLHYAMKANPMPAVVQHLSGLVDGLDVASIGEMHVALDTTMPADQISFAGPGKNDSELASAIAAGITINLESEQEMENVARLGNQLDLQPNVAIRVNPDFELKASGMKMGGGAQQFGVDTERLPAMLSSLQKLNLNFLGFHIFSGSQNLNAESIQEAHEKTLQLAMRLAEQTSLPIRSLNIGGGFGIPYFPGDNHLDLKAIGDNLEQLLPQVKRKLPTAEIVIELGRFMIAEAGIYVCRVLERKCSREKIFLVTDGGLHHHLAASGNFGQVIRKNYPVVIGNKVEGGEREVVSVVGPLCTPLDLLANQMEMAKANVGDYVVVLQSGAYGLTASPTSFLSHPAPLEVLV